MKLPVFLFLIGLLLSGCSTLDTHFANNASITRFKNIYVQRNLNENHGLDGLIVRELKSRGIQAKSGPMTLLPRDAKAYITYEDQWDWDFKDYLISLRMTVRDATTNRLLASVMYFRPTAFMKTPDYMVRKVLDGLLNPAAHSTESSPPASKTSSQNKTREQDQDSD
jgi:hypothetical protein